MAGQGLPVRLDRGVPFVDDVFAVMDGRKSLDAAVTTLLAAERAHGAAIWNEAAGESRLWAGFFVPRDRSSPPSLRTIMALLPDPDRFFAHLTTEEESDEPRLIAASLFPLLNSTQLILAGMDFTNDHFVRYADG